MWDQAAQWYDALVGLKGSEYQTSIILPGAFQMMNLRKGERVLDLACGQGVFSRYLFQKGMKVTGLDVSGEMIRFAQKRSDPSITFREGDAQDPKALAGETFDAAVCLLALQNIAAIEPVMANIKRWLKPGGRFVMVTTHPCFRIPRQTHWGWDDQKKIQYRRVDLYASETTIPILTPPLVRSKIFTVTYHRSLQNYFQALTQAGLCVDGLEEWTSHKTSEPGKRAKAENRARNEIPLFLALRAVAGVGGKSRRRS
ncbi:MAG: methyltransferase domain-containing protein [Nitrospinaceae bacterium]|nr:class I SAM-dependent methyltransferase [Nitrospinaceae bacterium]NIR55441.1 class I SAM-dependent methyltransferase [Nitrospinaceae bacterium]NIS85881.1 class I SAM-dependent methyltransferase [Nitrospinaceae bacterium]NIT82725.1 class I SAM-dependent methyltransferase [Nitrospinaceae bacterium]NIU44934.1 class I SAM-dependent methyltransferase [Nitrospinaceae bacterium]